MQRPKGGTPLLYVPSWNKKVTCTHSVDIQTSEVVTSPPLSHAHLPSSDAELDRWGWNEVYQMHLKRSHSKCVSPIGFILVIYQI